MIAFARLLAVRDVWLAAVDAGSQIIRGPGGIVSRPVLRMIGERGPELVIPLRST